jgi:hypothetical protein
MGSKFIKLSDLLVPLSMALVTLFDAEYLGIDYKVDGDAESNTK